MNIICKQPDTAFSVGKLLTETALLRVWSEMLMVAHERKATLLSLLDMSAVFNYVNHLLLLLLQRLQVSVGIGGTALHQIRLFLHGRTHTADVQGWIHTRSASSSQLVVHQTRLASGTLSHRMSQISAFSLQKVKSRLVLRPICSPPQFHNNNGSVHERWRLPTLTI
jgi:hypothetical protein